MLQTLSKVDPELAVTDAMHADHPPSLVSEHRTPMRVTALTFGSPPCQVTSTDFARASTDVTTNALGSAIGAAATAFLATR